MLRDPSSLSQFGHLLETFVVGELIRQASWLDQVAVCGHWRTYDGDEVDLVIERDDGRLLAFEVKAASRVDSASMRHLSRLRDELGERFLTGVALYTGTRSYRFDERLLVMPIDRLWTPV
jgi:predicted AAA+ superfamily ATPase